MNNLKKSFANINYLYPFYLFFILLTIFVSENIFFWDTVQLGSKHAHYFYENNFANFLLPDSIDSGHIPGFGVFLALAWKIFGKTLVVSHFVMLPFLLGIVFQADKLLKRYINKKYIKYALLLFLADPTLLGQATLISPDIILVFLFLAGLNAVLDNKNILKSIFIAGLFLISMRGMVAAFAILLVDVFLRTNFDTFKSTFVALLKKSIAYLPAVIILIAYAYYHYVQKSWLGYHDDSPWEANFKITDASGFIRNIGILGWRILDFGRVFLWLSALIILLLNRKKIFNDKNSIQIIFIFIFTFISLSISFLAYKSLNGHRYILPFLLIFSLFASYLIFTFIEKEKNKYIIFAFVFVGLISGNLWIYPEKIAQGWDSSLAQLHYFSLRKKMIKYMDAENIKIEETTCVFPNTSQIKFLELNSDTTAFKHKNEQEDKYVFYSNINNDFSDEDIDLYKNNFTLIKEYNSMGVFIKLYKNNK